MYRLTDRVSFILYLHTTFLFTYLPYFNYKNYVYSFLLILHFFPSSTHVIDLGVENISLATTDVNNWVLQFHLLINIFSSGLLDFGLYRSSPPETPSSSSYISLPSDTGKKVSIRHGKIKAVDVHTETPTLRKHTSSGLDRFVPFYRILSYGL